MLVVLETLRGNLLLFLEHFLASFLVSLSDNLVEAI